MHQRHLARARLAAELRLRHGAQRAARVGQERAVARLQVEAHGARGVVALLAHYLDEKFDTHHIDRLTSLPGGEYYVDMAVAWAFSVALVKHFEQTLPYFTQRRLDRRVHNKALQKGRESLRIDDARKTILQRLKY